MNKNIILLVLFFISQAFFAQENTNPIIFLDGNIGGGTANKLYVSFNVNYQFKQNLFTYRRSIAPRLVKDCNAPTELLIHPVLWFPCISRENEINEHALLYGRRYINDNFSYSFSAGVSYNEYDDFTLNTSSNKFQTEHYFGVPLQINIRWFKSEKDIYRIYGLIPVGEPTGFGHSLGISLVANISKHSYVGLAVSFGLGFYKEY